MPISLDVSELNVHHVLDLRRPAALDWLFQTIPSLRIVLNDKGDTAACFPHRPKLASFGDILPSLVDQQRGGGNFDKLVGLYLRQLGASGLVFPSARTDASRHSQAVTALVSTPCRISLRTADPSRPVDADIGYLGVRQ